MGLLEETPVDRGGAAKRQAEGDEGARGMWRA